VLLIFLKTVDVEDLGFSCICYPYLSSCYSKSFSASAYFLSVLMITNEKVMLIKAVIRDV